MNIEIYFYEKNAGIYPQTAYVGTGMIHSIPPMHAPTAHHLARDSLVLVS
jgi:hypothetical protein